MGDRDDKVVDNLRLWERRRVDELWHRRGAQDELEDAVVGLPYGEWDELVPAVATDLASNLDDGWLRAGAVLSFKDDTSRLFLRDVGGPDERLSIETYAVGDCRWCGEQAPLGEPRNRNDQTHDVLAIALITRDPADGHRCPGVVGLLRR